MRITSPVQRLRYYPTRLDVEDKPMFTTLNLRWMIDLKERETRALEGVSNSPQRHWLRTLVNWFRQLT